MSESLFFNILMHNRLLPFIQQKGARFRNEIQKTLERLQFGYWQGGTRVKVLSGVSRLVYEARINRAWRLLFTVSRCPTPKPPYTPELYLLIWDLLEHDAVERRARRINLQPEVGFLDFELLHELELEGTPDCPEIELTPEDSPTSVSTLLQTGRGKVVSTDLYDPIRWFSLAPDLVADEEEWERLFESGNIRELELKISLEQAETIHASGPVLLRGTAGSGKTTVSVYRLARAVYESPGSRILYATYSPALLAYSKRLFTDLIQARQLPPPPTFPEFFTFPELYARIAEIKAPEPIRYSLFLHWYRMIYRTTDAALAWEEIRGIIKGACLKLNRDHLSYADYERLGRKRAPLFIDQRPHLYKVFERYNDWRQRQNRCDDIDLARQALRQLKKEPGAWAYDQLICDEGQDLSELELALILELCRSPDGLFFAADPQQVVNPSGFRWAELRSQLRNYAPRYAGIEIRSLSRNYRSASSIVSLANAFIRVQRERTGRSDDDTFQESRLQGASPVVVSGDESEVLQYVKGFGPRCAVVAGDSEASLQLSRTLESERVFTIPESKGLEFDGCVLWNLLSSDSKLWRRILLDNQPMKEDPSARRAIHHAYVAVTRARRYLGIYETDERAAELWQSAFLRSQIEFDSPAALSRFMLSAATPDDWREEGEYFLQRGRFRQASECFRRAGDSKREQFSLAQFAESIEDYAEAARHYLEIDDPARAAACLEKSGNNREAAKLFVQLNKPEDAARNFEQAGQCSKAAKCFQQAGRIEDYRRCRLADLVRRRDWNGAAKIAMAQEDFTAAIQYYQRGGRRDRVRELRLRLAEDQGDFGQMAKIMRKAGKLADAAEYYRQMGDTRQMHHCLALQAEKKKDWGQAAREWRSIQESARMFSCLLHYAEEKQEWYQAAEYCRMAGMPQKIKKYLEKDSGEKAKLWLTALERESAGDLLGAGEIHEQLEHFDYADSVAQRAAQMLYVPVTMIINDPYPAPIMLHSIGRTFEERANISGVGELIFRLWFRRLYKEHSAYAAKVIKLVSRQYGRNDATLRFLGLIAEELEDYPSCARLMAKRKNPDAIKLAAAYRRADMPKKADVVMARYHEKREEWALSLEYWEKTGRSKDYNRIAGKLAEAEGRFTEALTFYRKARMTAQARRLQKWLKQPELIPRKMEPDTEV